MTLLQVISAFRRGLQGLNFDTDLFSFEIKIRDRKTFNYFNTLLTDNLGILAGSVMRNNLYSNDEPVGLTILGINFTIICTDRRKAGRDRRGNKD